MLRTSASSGDMTRRRSWSVLLGAMCSRGMSWPVDGCRYWTRLWCDSSVSSSILARVAENLHGRPGPERFVFFQSQVPAFPGFRVLGPGAAAARGQL